MCDKHWNFLFFFSPSLFYFIKKKAQVMTHEIDFMID